ncbi:MAG: MerR family transcriptional regulator [Anaerolineae bacterium]|nr:MerR family transcriptional regulator [Anaerolineae bacterium]
MGRFFSIGELAKEAGVSVRTIRFYIDEGLIPPPEVRGRNTLYSEEYLDRIELIRRLKEAYLPLREIRQKMQGLSDDAVRKLLGKGEQAQQSAIFPQRFETAESSPIQQKTVREAESAVEYIARILDVHNTTPRSPNQPRPGLPSASSKQDLDPSNRPQLNSSSAPLFQSQTTWQRIILAPGIELHISQPILAEKRTEIQLLINTARQLFESKRA